MKKFLSFFLSICMIAGSCLLCELTTCAYTEDTYTDGDYEYTVDGGGYATITKYIRNGWVSGTLTIPAKLGGYPVRYIGSRAFYPGCYADWSCNELIIPEGVEQIDDEAFMHCWTIRKLSIPASLRGMGDGVFADCNNIETITVAEGNKYYSIIDGNLYYKYNGYTTLVLFAGYKWRDCFTVPDGVTHIDAWGLFPGNFDNIVIPNSVTYVGTQAFRGCDATDVYYTGSEAEWNAIRFDGVFSYPEDATIHFDTKLVSDVLFNPEAKTVTAGYSENLFASVMPADATNTDLVWTTSDSTVATVNNGVVTGVNAGTATITATAKLGGHSSSCVVTVEKAEIVGIKATDLSDFGIPVVTVELQIQNLPDAAVVFLAAYDKSHTLIEARLLSAQSLNTSVSNKNAEYIKAFVWKDIKSFMPLCEPKTKRL